MPVKEALAKCEPWFVGMAHSYHSLQVAWLARLRV